MTRASELKKSDVIEVNGTLYAIRQIEVQSPSARGAATLYRVKASAVGGGPKFEERFKGDDDVATVELQRRPVQFSYVDGDDYIFMDNEDFSQYLLKQEDISDELAFITEETEGVLALRVEESVIGLDLPASVAAWKGRSRTSRLLPARYLPSRLRQLQSARVGAPMALHNSFTAN